VQVELNELRYFYNVATTRSFAEGARRSHISGPAISKAIKKLEDTLGVKLLQRTTRRVTITASGELVLDYCRRVLNSLSELESELESRGRALQGDLRIGAMEAFTAYMLPRAISKIVAAHPRLIPRVYRVGPREQEHLLAEGRLDIGLCFGLEQRSESSSRHMLARSPALLVCGRGHPLFEKRTITVEDLEEFPFVATHELHDERGPTDTLPPGLADARIGATADTLQLALQLVMDGAFLGCFPEIAVRCQLNHDELHAVEGIDPQHAFEMTAVTQSSRASVALLLDTLEEAVAEVLARDCAVPTGTVATPTVNAPRASSANSPQEPAGP